MGRTHGRAPIGHWAMSGACVPEERVEAVDNAERLLDVFETSLQEAITKRRRANDSDVLSSDDEELGDRIWELIGSRLRKKPSLRPTTTLGRIYSITRLLWQPGLQLRLPRELGLLLLLRLLLQKAPSLLLWLPGSLLQRQS